MLVHMVRQLEAGPLWTAEVTLSLPTIRPRHLSYTGLRRHVVVLCNGREAGFFPDSGGFGDVILGNELQKGRNTLRLLLWGTQPEGELDNVRVHALTNSVSAGGTWSYRRWEIPAGQGRLVGKQLPAWYRSGFKADPGAGPLFLRIGGARKGQVFLNGHNVGRFWSIGPQEFYYLPEPWVQQKNELLVFEEEGNIPSGSSLALRPLGAYQQ
jgi:hypothetical protein